jgi:hypothetical protein
MKYEFFSKNNSGKDVKISVVAKNGKVRTMDRGSVYTLDGLIKLAATGELTEKELEENTALVGVSQATAKKWLEAAAIGNSDHLEVVITELETEVKPEIKPEPEAAKKAEVAKAKAKFDANLVAAKAEADAKLTELNANPAESTAEVVTTQVVVEPA